MMFYILCKLWDKQTNLTFTDKHHQSVPSQNLLCIIFNDSIIAIKIPLMHNHKRSQYEIQKFSCLSNEKASNLWRCKDFVIYIGAICTCIEGIWSIPFLDSHKDKESMKKERKIFKFYTWKLLRKFKVQNDSNDRFYMLSTMLVW